MRWRAPARGERRIAEERWLTERGRRIRDSAPRRLFDGVRAPGETPTDCQDGAVELDIGALNARRGASFKRWGARSMNCMAGPGQELGAPGVCADVAEIPQIVEKRAQIEELRGRAARSGDRGRRTGHR